MSSARLIVSTNVKSLYEGNLQWKKQHMNRSSLPRKQAMFMLPSFDDWSQVKDRSGVASVKNRVGKISWPGLAS